MDAWIFDAVRTPRGKARAEGGLAAMKPQQLIGGLVDALEARGHTPRSAESLTLGCVGQVGSQGGHIALVSKLHVVINDAAMALTLNNYCVSGLTAIGLAARQVAGRAVTAVAGGIEMMSQVPFMGDKAGYYTDASFPKRVRYVPVVLAADRLAEAQGVTRDELDRLALSSQQRAVAAETNNMLQASRIAVNNLLNDECVRAQTTAESLAAMPPAFAAIAEQYADALDGPIDHRHTIAHAPPVCDGAAIALIGGIENFGAGRVPRARIVAYAEAGGDPHASLLAGMTAMDRVLQQSGLSLEAMDRIEFMEAFAVTMALFVRRYRPDLQKTNVAGGHMAKGHPMGASGAILLSSLLDALDEGAGRYGLVVCSGAGGVGAAMIVERIGG
ncbi:MAG: acyl-CoA thiolase [Gammaproteobacteria bacterium]|jgi:acetyl-CoA C-acetyltransferase/acetyl-CoA acyltransferase|nr:acyl-CoA thiolase [Gammaproteobacteria bacterium]